MHINEDGTVYLDKGEAYIEEHALETGNRVAIITLTNGMEVHIIRSYAHIRPSVVGYDGHELHIELDRSTGTLRPSESPYPDWVDQKKFDKHVAELAAIAEELLNRVSGMVLGSEGE